MLRPLRDMIRRIGFVGGVLLTVAFAMPALASHACASELSPPSVETTAIATVDALQGCLDCGPACANGCCHGHHATPASDGVAPTESPVFPTASGWTQASGRLLGEPSGLERPPRL